MTVFVSGFVNYTWEVFIILDADSEHRAAEMQKQISRNIRKDSKKEVQFTSHT